MEGGSPPVPRMRALLALADGRGRLFDEEMERTRARIQSVHRALTGVTAGPEAIEAPPKEPAVPVRRSITPDHLVCLEDGRKFKSLKRHLRTKYNMSPEEYRTKWGLAKDYPMVAPNYAKARSELAKQMGLGQGGRQAARAGAKRRG